MSGSCSGSGRARISTILWNISTVSLGTSGQQIDQAEEDFRRLTTQHVYATYEVWTFLKIVDTLRRPRKGRVIEVGGLVELLGFDELRVRVEPGARDPLRMPDGNVLGLRYKPHFGSYCRPDKPYSVSLSKDPDIARQLAAENAIWSSMLSIDWTQKL
jgi:hypothetical protein